MKRREFLKKSSIAALSLAAVDICAKNVSGKIDFEEAYEDAVKGAKKIYKNSKKIKLKIPKDVKSGLVVPVEVDIDYPMEGDRYIEHIYILATKNPVANIVKANYTFINAKAYLFVNIKLSETQEVVVLAKSNIGEIFEKRKRVKVAISGCS
ncbi:thiosulfate oxidation carrier protein SoxY [Nitrosophilus labii]|uniref:thiosulfate oxidation carrier protein SoxY n=1 Tax=Nitrosophilus labii TaxID=2706014 RepID=UPI0016571228|nr:thiosulfate oxidation carrier protein SoxY [Nitrosophilus labii]